MTTYLKLWSTLLVTAGLSALTACKVTGSDTSVKADAAAADDPAVNHQPDVYDCKAHEYGFYWYGKGNVAAKLVDGQTNPFYDATKPTVIYVHGWQSGSTAKGHRENFMYQRPDTNAVVDVAAAWIDAGWNVGIYYWMPFADEQDVRTAEAKVWTVNGPGAMRWRQCDGSFSTAGAPQVPMGELFYRDYLKAMAGYEGTNIRIVGHSLGNQMAARLSDQLMKGVAAGKVNPRLMPSRVALVDPYWTMGEKDNVLPGAKVRAIVQDLTALQIPVEWYKCSGLLDILSFADQADVNRPLIDVIGQIKPQLEFIADSNPLVRETNRHVSASKLYFWSFASPTPTGCAPKCDQKVPSAAMSDSDLGPILQQKSVWKQTSGQTTPDQSDDVYTKQ